MITKLVNHDLYSKDILFPSKKIKRDYPDIPTFKFKSMDNVMFCCKYVGKNRFVQITKGNWIHHFKEFSHHFESHALPFYIVEIKNRFTYTYR